MRRLALLPATVLEANRPAWMADAVPAILHRDLLGSHAEIVFLSDGESDIYKANCDHAVEARVDGRVQAEIRSISDQRVAELPVGSGDFIAQVDAIAKAIQGDADVFPTRNEQALGFFVQGLESKDAGERAKWFRQAIGSDPGFGAAYVELLAAEPTPDNEALGLKVRDRFSRLDAARWDVIDAQLRRAPLAKQIEAGRALVAATPNDADAHAALARAELTDGKADSVAEVQRAMQIQGQGQYEGEYLQALTATRQLAKAAQALQEQTSNGMNALERAAILLMAGQKTEAAKAAEAAQAGGDAGAAMRRAQWLAATGDLNGAIAALPPNLAPAQAAVWKLESGQVENLRIQNESPGVAAFLSFIGKDFNKSAEQWRAIYEQSGHADLQSRVMLAASLSRAGRTAEAAQVGVVPILPNLSGADVFASLVLAEEVRLLTSGF